MAGTNVANPGGFSYAQAAKGRVSAAGSQSASSKVNSGAATPATGMPSELGSSGNWADDVEVSVAEKGVESNEVKDKEEKDMSKQADVKSSAVERTKTEDKMQISNSGISSPDLAPSADSHDDSSSAQNGSSQTSWDVKSQSSEPTASAEPAWIAERKERQSTTQQSESKEKQTPEEPAPKPVELHEAPPPSVNPWAKLAEQSKARMAAIQQAAKPVAPKQQSAAPAAAKENQRPKAESRKKNNSVAGVARDVDGPVNGSRKPLPQGNARPDASATNGVKAPHSERQNATQSSVVPPPVKDEVSWPTPDTAQENERKSTEKEGEEKEGDDDAAGKGRRATEWKPFPVVPNIIWETQGVREKNARAGPGGERGSRGGASARGRGGLRGAPNGVASGDRSLSRPHGFQPEDVAGRRARPDAVERDSTQATSRTRRASSVGSNGARNIRRKSGAELVKNGTAQTVDSTKDQLPVATEQASAASAELQISKEDSSPEDPASEEKVPGPIPRRSSVATQTETTNGQPAESAARDIQPIKTAPTEHRKDTRAVEGFRDPAFRGSKRGGRGRGGSREVVNGHHGGHPFGNGATAEFGAPAGFGMPQSPTAFNPPRGGHQNGFPNNGRGNWRGGNARAQTAPADGFYTNRFAQPYSGAHPQLHPVQTFGPAMYGYGDYPMTAIPYSPYVDQSTLMHLVSLQVEYYFSIDNLIKDMYLRKNMDSQGFVSLEVIAAFNRIKQLTTDTELIKLVCLNSTYVQICIGEDGKERLRRANEWSQFILPVEERFPAARNDGPSRLDRPEAPVPTSYGPPMHMRGPASAFFPNVQQRFGDRRSFDQGFAMQNGMSPHAQFFPEGGDGTYGEMQNGDEARGRSITSTNNFVPGHQSHMVAASPEQEGETDAFPDQHIEQLTVCVKMREHKAPYHTAASRTFSDGSINVHKNVEKQVEGDKQPTTNGETLTNGNGHSTTESRESSPNDAASSSPEPSTPAANDLSVFWIKDNDNPVGTLPSDLVPEPYVQLRLKAFEQRSQAATGNCPYDLDVLYQFWSHFLIRNYNTRMYTEFKQAALEDAGERHSFVGRKNLLKFYGQALSSNHTIQAQVVKDYVELVNAEKAGKAEGEGEQKKQEEGVAFKQLRAAWRNGALPLRNRKRLNDVLDQELRQMLEV